MLPQPHSTLKPNGDTGLAWKHEKELSLFSSMAMYYLHVPFHMLSSTGQISQCFHSIRMPNTGYGVIIYCAYLKRMESKIKIEKILEHIDTSFEWNWKEEHVDISMVHFCVSIFSPSRFTKFCTVVVLSHSDILISMKYSFFGLQKCGEDCQRNCELSTQIWQEDNSRKLSLAFAGQTKIEREK